MEIRGRRLAVIGGAGLIGSHAVEQLVAEDVAEIVIYDNFSRGSLDNLESVIDDPRLRVYEMSGDICQSDILNAALKVKGLW